MAGDPRPSAEETLDKIREIVTKAKRLGALHEGLSGRIEDNAKWHAIGFMDIARLLEDYDRG